MSKLQDKLEKLILEGLRDSMADLETLPNGHVSGHVISPSFEGKDYEQRRLCIRQVLDRAVHEGVLSTIELQKVSTLLTYTPAEWSVATSDNV